MTWLIGTAEDPRDRWERIVDIGGGPDLPSLSDAYADAGGDPDRCEFCDEPLDDQRPWQRGLDGAGAHEDCIP